MTLLFQYGKQIFMYTFIAMILVFISFENVFQAEHLMMI